MRPVFVSDAGYGSRISRLRRHILLVIRAPARSQEEEEGAAVDMVVAMEAVEVDRHSPEPKATTCAKS
jgi:hypothetical protein